MELLRKSQKNIILRIGAERRYKNRHAAWYLCCSESLFHLKPSVNFAAGSTFCQWNPVERMNFIGCNDCTSITIRHRYPQVFWMTDRLDDCRKGVIGFVGFGLFSYSYKQTLVRVKVHGLTKFSQMFAICLRNQTLNILILKNLFFIHQASYLI